jgi:hypothetical protein
MGPFFGPNPWAQQAHAQAMSCLQAGGRLEALGNLAAAGPYYHQASQALSASIQMLGPQTPDITFYWLGFCQVRLGFLTGASGNAVWAQEWLRQALSNFQTAWQRNPGHPGYQMAATQLALALGEIQQAQRFCQQPAAGHPQLANLSQVVRNLNQPTATPTPSDANGLAKKVKDWLDVGGKAVDILSTLMKMCGGSGASGGTGMPGGFGMGMGGMGMGGMNMGGNPFGM